MENILNSIKKLLGIAEDYTQFDADIIMHLNSAFATLQQLGVGPPEGFMIEDDSATWIDYIGESATMSSVKTYLYLKVRMVFDPPTSSFVMDALDRQAKELEWRLNTQAELEVSETV